MKNCLLITPPFTQLNTPYPATAYLKGFLNSIHRSSFQADLGLEVILQLFSPAQLTAIFNQFNDSIDNYSLNAQRIYTLRAHYIRTITPVISFLQGNNTSLALKIVQTGFLPQASRFSQLDDMDWAFGIMGSQDKAKHLATLYLEDLSDFIIECVDLHFGFSRYAEQLGRSANSFDELYESLQLPLSLIDHLLIEALEKLLNIQQPKVVLLSVPFPGNLYAAFRIAQYMKLHTAIPVIMGGGFANTELRSLSDIRVFDFLDYLTLDDGEAPLECLLNFIESNQLLTNAVLKRTFTRVNHQVVYINNASLKDYKQQNLPAPDYSDLKLNQYISVLAITNPMHRLWSDGCWNKLTMAHGCYWARCSFCDVSLNYINHYDPNSAQQLCDHIETLIKQTGNTSFHFVDEAAPPALMRSLALEILRRNLVITWWTNVRFEKSFTEDLCILLKTSGCIAVSGGLEVASPRILELINKGVTVEQVAITAKNLTDAGIMVHAYLMYGFPSQTAQETIDSLEVVRQLFKCGIVQSGFWHQFALTAHSPIGLNSEKYGIHNHIGSTSTFAHNDLVYTETNGVHHAQFSSGLKTALFNYLCGEGYDLPLKNWFNFKVPPSAIKPNYIEEIITRDESFIIKPSAKILWLGTVHKWFIYEKRKQGRSDRMMQIDLHNQVRHFTIKIPAREGEWLIQLLEHACIQNKLISMTTIEASFEDATLNDFQYFWFSKPMKELRKAGLLTL